VLQYHTGDKYATKATEARFQDYRVRGTPTMIFNGGNIISGGSNESYGQYSRAISSAAAKKSLVSISGTFSPAEGNSINAAVTNLGSNELKSLKLMAVTFEDLGTAEHRYVVREILTPAPVASLQPQIAQNFSFKPGTMGGAVKAVIFLQSASNEVLQSTLVNIGQ
jgi:hypothetical protein